jgi:peptidoglycan hydrolase CwlO-like protein
MGILHSKLANSAYDNCPLCGVTTDIKNRVDGLEGKIEELYKILSDRNEMIHDLQKKLSDLRSKTEKITGTNLQEH